VGVDVELVGHKNFLPSPSGEGIEGWGSGGAQVPPPQPSLKRRRL